MEKLRHGEKTSLFPHKTEKKQKTSLLATKKSGEWIYTS